MLRPMLRIRAERRDLASRIQMSIDSDFVRYPRTGTGAKRDIYRNSVPFCVPVRFASHVAMSSVSFLQLYCTVKGGVECAVAPAPLGSTLKRRFCTADTAWSSQIRKTKLGGQRRHGGNANAQRRRKVYFRARWRCSCAFCCEATRLLYPSPGTPAPPSASHEFFVR